MKDAILTAAAVRWIGRISFSVYVLHFPIDSLVVSKLASHFGAAFTARYPAVQLLALPIVAGATLALAHLSYRYVELPFHRHGRAVARWVAGQFPGIRAQIAPATTVPELADRAQFITARDRWRAIRAEGDTLWPCFSTKDRATQCRWHQAGYAEATQPTSEPTP